MSASTPIRFLVGHKEWAWPRGRKPDPKHSMDWRRNRVQRAREAYRTGKLFMPGKGPTTTNSNTEKDEMSLLTTKYKEYIDQNGNKVRDLRTVPDIWYSTHAASVMALRVAQANQGALAALARLLSEKVDLTEDRIRAIVAEEIAEAVGELPNPNDLVAELVTDEEEPA
jgi:hypothetical protein